MSQTQRPYNPSHYVTPDSSPATATAHPHTVQVHLSPDSKSSPAGPHSISHLSPATSASTVEEDESDEDEDGYGALNGNTLFSLPFAFRPLHVSGVYVSRSFSEHENLADCSRNLT